MNPGKEMGRRAQPAGWLGHIAQPSLARGRPATAALAGIPGVLSSSLQDSFQRPASQERLSAHFSFTQAREAFCLSGPLTNQWPQMGYFYQFCLLFHLRTGSVPSFHLFTLCSVFSWREKRGREAEPKRSWLWVNFPH